MLNEIELYECIPEGLKEDGNFTPGHIVVSRVSEDGTISQRVVDYFPEDLLSKEFISHLTKRHFFDPDKMITNRTITWAWNWDWD